MYVIKHVCPHSKTIDVANEARRRAHKSAQKAGATRKIEDKRRKPEKHRKPLGDE